MIPTNEQETIALFAQLAPELGYKFIELGTSCPDAILQKNGQRVRAEFEHKARNFQKHNHPIEDADIIICWHDDWTNSPLPVLSLENYVTLTRPMSRWERFWAWWSSLWLTRIKYMAEVKETRKKNRAKKFCKVCGTLMNPRCTHNGFNVASTRAYNEGGTTCPKCGYYRHFEVWHQVR